MLRDFTYYRCVVEGVKKVVESTRESPDYNIYNIGRGEPVELMNYIELLGENLGVKPNLEMLPMQPGDVTRTMADTSALKKNYKYSPQVKIEQGVKLFAQWYEKYYST